MTKPSFRNWQSVQDEVMRRIHAREWLPGELIPNEVDLAVEFGCARTTVNRALRSLAETGRLDRRRKAGTRVAAHPVAKATLDIAVIRHEVAERGLEYGYQLLSRDMLLPPVAVAEAMKTKTTEALLHVRALHLAENLAYAYEDRWINCAVAPEAANAPFDSVSANEWLLKNAPYSHGDIAFSAVAVSKPEAAFLSCPAGAAAFAMNRTTWDKTRSVTKVRLLFRPGYEMRTGI